MSKRRKPQQEAPPGGGSELQVDEALLLAAGMDPLERRDYLAAVDRDHPELAQELRRRLKAVSEMSTTFLDYPAAERLTNPQLAGAGAPSAKTLSPEQRYSLGPCLGTGGMGQVFRARDQHLDREVALKLLNHDAPEVRDLFLREARHQARVRHPHVLDVYDSGELEGRPFVSMRLVDGRSLAEIGPLLPLEQKVRLLVQAAKGLHAAHRAGLLHRDVKPSNILVEALSDGELRALVTDFGLAVEIRDTLAGAADPVAGSPQYIAPERLNPDSAPEDRRADVYSLGVTMYRVLTGSLPLDADNTVDMLRQSREAAIVPPGKRIADFPADLEAVILRCMARDPAERYASARAVADELIRFLDGEVVEAYAASLAFRLTRWLLRNRAVAALAGVALCALVGATIAVSVFALRADAARERAELRQAQAEGLIRFTVVDLHDKLDELGRLDVLADVGDAARAYFAAVPETDLSPAEKLQQSRMLYQIARVQIRQGRLNSASAALEQSLQLAEHLSRLNPEHNERRFELAQSHFWAGYLAWQRGSLGSARPHFERYLVLATKLVEGEPDNLKWQQELAHAHSNLGSLQRAENDLEAALKQFQATLAIDQQLADADPDDAEARSELAASHNMVGTVLQDLGRLDIAGEHLATSMQLRRELSERDHENPRYRDLLGTSHNDFGVHLGLVGQWSEAKTHFQQAHELFAELTGHDPKNVQWQFKLAWSHINLARAHLIDRDSTTAADELGHARRLVTDLLEQDDPHAWRRTGAVIDYHLALLDLLHGRSQSEAIEPALEALKALAAERPGDLSVHRWLVQTHLVAGALAASPAKARSAWKRAEQTIGTLARDGNDIRLILPWKTALKCLGQDQPVPVVGARTLIDVEPGLDQICPATSHERQHEENPI
ncbi:serine/threonine protein kinase [Wenzhouxiangella sp. AB-CW3]|uniref:serine/threonine-protein kinase n=1 Tax=Wenzhouxiangella sp. AB-CW3 TaxID=2771012 RepID=UPI00168A92A4|nr:serine/threonine-protein kinase [Wenzhouxiangella sp. AB-CW3]QOC22369.1 serine/threonine protein kinase [Wenzhouxiangella sp. AB-CW3]